jgi:CRP/FNR family cyclic AMP-dependent transcriptional regulator
MLKYEPLENWKVARKAKGASFDPDVFLTTVNHGRSLSERRTGQTIFSQGDAADSVFYIVRGKIKISATSEQGREAVVGVLGERDFFGEGCLISQRLRLATAVSMTDSAVMRIEKAEMIRVLRVEPALAEVFTTHLLTRNSRVEADLIDHLFNSSENGWPVLICCWRILASRERPNRSRPKLARGRLRR